jgi:crossover junction endodeoxyribonuclease RuvC
MRVLGIDPGTQVAGYGILDITDGDGQVSLVAIGAFRLPRKEPLTARLLALRDNLESLLDEVRPDEVAVEAPFVATNVRAAFAIGEARGVALLSAAARHLPVHQYPPATVKQTVAGHGGATKADIARMVALHVALPEQSLPADATDAMAVALCHAFHVRSTARGL